MFVRIVSPNFLKKLLKIEEKINKVQTICDLGSRKSTDETFGQIFLSRIVITVEKKNKHHRLHTIDYIAYWFHSLSKIFTFFAQRSGRIVSGDQLMPLYVLDTMGNVPGLTGLFVAGIFSSALSSVSPILNSLAAVTIEDYVKVSGRN